MLKAEFFIISSGEIIGFNISGHSDCAEKGYDIVCAAVSSAAYMTVNTITDIIGVYMDITLENNIGHMKALISKENASRCADILKGFKTHLLLLEEIYSKNIKVSYSEV